MREPGYIHRCPINAIFISMEVVKYLKRKANLLILFVFHSVNKLFLSSHYKTRY